MKIWHYVSVFTICVSISVNCYAKPKEEMFADINVPAAIAECVAELPPSIGELHQLAMSYARLTPDDLSRWKKNVKYSAFLPRLQFGYERKVTDSFDLNLADSVSVTSAGVNVGPTDGGWGRGLDRNNNIRVTAVWYLDEILFNKDDLSISSEARSQMGARRDMLGEITDNYIELKRLIAIYKTKSPEAAGVRGLVRLQIEKKIGQLDVLTGRTFNRSFNWKEVSCE